MNHLLYEITEHKEENISVYGLRISDAQRIIREYNSVSALPSKAKLLKNRLEHNDISVLHLNDIVEDYFYEQYCEHLRANGLD